MAEKINLSSRTNQIFISLCLFFGNFQLDSLHSPQQYSKYLGEINKGVEGIFNEEVCALNDDLSFLISSLKLANQVLLSRFDVRDMNSPQSAFLADKYREVGGENYDEYLLRLLTSIGDNYWGSRDQIRQVLKSLLEFLWCLKIKDINSFQDMIREDQKSEVLLALFGEVMLNENLQIQFFDNISRKTLLGNFVFYYLDSFPYSDEINQEFCKMILLLLSNCSSEFADFIMYTVSNLQRVSFELKSEPEYRTSKEEQDLLEQIEKKALV